jgi:tRNA(Phe) wybutosine-synthesizing methylase Tyw3
MNIPTGNFFEVTINSQKLFSFIEEINKQLKHQESQLVALSSKINGMVSSVQEETRTQSRSHDI